MRGTGTAGLFLFEGPMSRLGDGGRVMGQRWLGIDLGGTNIKMAVLEEDEAALPVPVASATIATDAAQGTSAVAERLIDMGRKSIADHGPVRGVGLAVPGTFEPDGGRIAFFPNLPGAWEGYPLRQEVEAGLGTGISMINDARAFTLAEATLGAARGCHTVVGVVMGTGIGGGLMVGGKLHLGAFGAAGEIGHQTVEPDGPLCGCGNRGCVEAVAKADVITSLAGMESTEQVFAAAATGDERARGAIAVAAGYLGIAIANAVTLLGPDRIVLGGGIAEAGALLLDPVRQAVRERVWMVPGEKVEVVLADLGPEAGSIGAALAARSDAEERDRSL